MRNLSGVCWLSRDDVGMAQFERRFVPAVMVGKTPLAALSTSLTNECCLAAEKLCAEQKLLVLRRNGRNLKALGKLMKDPMVGVLPRKRNISTNDKGITVID